MQHAIISTTLGLAILGLAAIGPAAAIAGEVYQWKDANGVTHYSETPPPKGAYKQRVISSGGQAQAPVTAAVAPAEDAQCTTARANLALLQGKARLQLDTDGDGKPETPMSDSDRANQMELAQATLKANCTAPAAKP